MPGNPFASGASGGVGSAIAAAKAPAIGGGSSHGGLDAGTYTVNPDGSLTIIKDSAAHNPDAPTMVGARVEPNGEITPAPGSPLAAASKGDLWLGVTPAGQPATDNPNYKGNGLTKIIDTVGDAITKDNPIAGTVRAGYDLATGKGLRDVGNDIVQGTTFGGVGVDPKSGDLTTGDQTNHAADIATDIAPKIPVPDLSGLLTPATGDGVADQGLADARGASNTLATGLGNERAGFAGTAAPIVGNVQVDQSQIDPLRARQNASLDDLTAASKGLVPSAAELQAKIQADRAASQQFGQAAALQGGMSAGGALRQASTGAAQVLGDVANQNAVLRANEQAQARQQLVGALSGVRGAEQDLGTTNAGLTQQGNLANQNSQIQTTGQDFDWKKALLSGQNTANQTAEQAAAAAAAAEAQRIASENAYKGALVGAGGSILGKLLT